MKEPKGHNPKNKIEFFNGIFHAGAGVIFLLKNHLVSLPDCQNAFCMEFELYYVYIVVEVTMKMAETKCKIRFIHVRFNCERKKGVGG